MHTYVNTQKKNVFGVAHISDPFKLYNNASEQVSAMAIITHTYTTHSRTHLCIQFICIFIYMYVEIIYTVKI